LEAIDTVGLAVISFICCGVDARTGCIWLFAIMKYKKI
jgi:hypothetical protein